MEENIGLQEDVSNNLIRGKEEYKNEQFKGEKESK